MVAALARRANIAVHDIPVAALGTSLLHYARGRIAAPPGLPDPQLLIGAGRRCQWPLLAARRARGGRAIYLMKPALPAAAFDLCFIPRHDRPPSHPRVVATEGVLNDIVAGSGTGSDGLILVGGPSTHHGWDEPRLLAQIEKIVASDAAPSWVITDSRRTPASTSARLRTIGAPHVRYEAASEHGPDWLNGMLGAGRCAWVSADSVSMLFEALSAGLPVGVLDVPAQRPDRIASIAADLARRQLVTRFDDWVSGQALVAAEPLAEADRAADIVLSHAPQWFAPRPAGRHFFSRRHHPCG